MCLRSRVARHLHEAAGGVERERREQPLGRGPAGRKNNRVGCSPFAVRRSPWYKKPSANGQLCTANPSAFNVCRIGFVSERGFLEFATLCYRSALARFARLSRHGLEEPAISDREG